MVRNTGDEQSILYQRIETLDAQVQQMQAQLLRTHAGTRLVGGTITGIVPAGSVVHPTIIFLINNSGGSLADGDVVVNDSSLARGIKTSTTADDILAVGVVRDVSSAGPFANGAETPVMVLGYHPTVKTHGVVAAGGYLGVSTTVKEAHSQGATPASGAFALAESASAGGDATVGAFIFGTLMAAAQQAYTTVEDEGTPLTQRSTMNFVGGGVTAADSGGITVVTIPAGAGGVAKEEVYVSFGVNESGQTFPIPAVVQTPPAFQAHGSGVYYGAPCIQFTPTTASYIANFIRATPFYVPYDGTYDRAALEVTAAAAGHNRIGVWGPIPSTGAINSLPLLLDTGSIDTSATGIKTATISLVLTQGWYIIGQVSDSTNTLRAYPAGALIGEIGDAVPFGGNRTKNYYFASFTYGALPNPITTLAAAGDSDLMPMVQLRHL